MSDQALMETIGTYVKQHRLRQNRSQTDVATAAGISRSTLSLLERGETTTMASLLAVLRVLDLLDVMDVFSIRQEISPIAYAKLQKKRRQRSSKSTNPTIQNDALEW